MTAREILQSARIRMARLPRYRYYAVALLSLDLVETSLLATLAVDEHWRLYYNPEFVLEYQNDIEMLCRFLEHEVNHLLRKHAERARFISAEPERWNIAADAEINQHIKGLPTNCVFPEKLGLPRGNTAEWYYHHMPDEFLGSQGQSTGNSHGGNIGSSSQTGSDNINDSQECDPSSGENSKSDNGSASRAGTRPQVAHGHCGSCATGKSEDYELPPDDKDHPGVPDWKKEVIRKQVAREIKEAVSRDPGSVPGDLARWAEEILCNQKVDWRNALRACIRKAIKGLGLDDYTYRRPSRKQPFTSPAILPANVEKTPKVAVVIDTSGSVDHELLSQALGEVKGILRSVGEKLTVISCDTQVRSVQKVFSVKQVKLVGGGGTNLVPGIEFAAKVRPRPSVVIVITDGYCSWPEQKPAGVNQVIICLVDNPGDAYPLPSWARVVRAEK